MRSIKEYGKWNSRDRTDVRPMRFSWAVVLVPTPGRWETERVRAVRRVIREDDD